MMEKSEEYINLNKFEQIGIMSGKPVFKSAKKFGLLLSEDDLKYELTVLIEFQKNLDSMDCKFDAYNTLKVFLIRKITMIENFIQLISEEEEPCLKELSA